MPGKPIRYKQPAVDSQSNFRFIRKIELDKLFITMVF